MAIAFKPHYDSLLLEDARATDWLDHLNEFPKWEKYIPNRSVKHI